MAFFSFLDSAQKDLPKGMLGFTSSMRSSARCRHSRFVACLRLKVCLRLGRSCFNRRRFGVDDDCARLDPGLRRTIDHPNLCLQLAPRLRYQRRIASNRASDKAISQSFELLLAQLAHIYIEQVLLLNTLPKFFGFYIPSAGRWLRSHCRREPFPSAYPPANRPLRSPLVGNPARTRDRLSTSCSASYDRPFARFAASLKLPQRQNAATNARFFRCEILGNSAVSIIASQLGLLIPMMLHLLSSGQDNFRVLSG
jgi:hypothetical protein